MTAFARATPPLPRPPGRLKYHFVRLGLRFFVRCYLRVRVEGAEQLPTNSSYVLCFSHPNWIDPMLVVGFWPDRRWLLIFGPREEHMGVGRRNAIIRWAGLGLPFKPSRSDLIETTRRAVGALRGGYILAVAGEGRLSEREGAIVPLQEGPAFLALRAGVPVVPLAIVGTRWLRFGKPISLRIGPAIATSGRRSDRATVGQLTAAVQSALEGLLEGVQPEPPPGPFGRWLTDVFNVRPWLAETGGSEDESRPDQPNGGAARQKDN